MNRYEFVTDPTWPDLHNPAESAHRAEAELSALRSRLRELIAAGRSKQGWVSCNVLEREVER